MKKENKKRMIVVSIIIIIGIISIIGIIYRSSNKNLSQINISQGQDPGNLDPTTNTQFYAVTILNHMFEGLMKYENDGNGNAKLVGGQTSSYNVSDDGLVYTFILRDDAKWSDDKKVTAYDFEYAWNRATNPENAVSYAYMITSLNATWKAINQKTFEVKLKVPTPYFLEICAFPVTFPIREDIINKYGDKWSLNEKSLISNGAYKISKYKHSSYVLLEKNNKYYAKNDVLNKNLKFYFYDDANASLAAYKSGEIDFSQNYTFAETKSLKKSGDLKINNSLGTGYLAFNNKDKIFSNKKIRQAFSLVLDREYIVNTIIQGGQKPAGAFVSFGTVDEKGTLGKDFRTTGGNYFDLKNYKNNCEKARELLAEAGYPNGKKFPIVDFNSNFGDDFNEAIENMWEKELGVEVSITSEESAIFLQRLADKKYQIAFTAWIANYNDPVTFLDIFETNSGNNIIGFSNKNYDELINKAKLTDNQTKRMQNLHKAEDILMNDYAIAPLYYLSSATIQQNLNGIFYSPLGYYFFNETTKNNKNK